MVLEDPAPFAALAADAFSGLLEEGFRLVEERSFTPPGWDHIGLWTVRYESDVVFIEIMWNTMEMVASFKIARLDHPRDSINDYELAVVSDAQPPTSSGEMASQVAGLARLLAAVGGPALRAETGVYDRANQLSASYTRRFTKPSGGQPPTASPPFEPDR